MLLSRFLLALLIAVTVAVFLTACHRGVYHTVEPGQTLFRISRTYEVDSDYLARINNISDPTQLRSGTRLFIPGADQSRRVAVVTSPPASSTARTTPPLRPPPPTASSPVPAPVPRPTQRPPSPPPKVASVPQKKLNWPLKGQIIRQFSSSAEAGAGRGIEIAAKPGTSVLAAETGRVIYSGDGVSGYGHLVILQHDNQLFTVYGFNQRTLVDQGVFVSQGDKIALSGTPPAGGEPRLHFEVRSGKVPVNPQLYLP
ncbi:MAG: M23 family metallopeptidase [Pelovirga sp.]